MTTTHNPSPDESGRTKERGWLPFLCRVGLHRWRSGINNTRRGTYVCERCDKHRDGRVQYRPTLPPR